MFLRDLGQALHVSGAPAQDMERGLNEIGSRLGIRVEGFAVLTFLAISVVSGERSRRVEMLRLPPYDYNMARLIALQELCRDIADLDALDTYAVARLAAIMQAPPIWSGWRFVAMGFLLSCSVALLLRGGWVEMLCGGLIGMGFVAGYLRLSRISRLGPAVPVILCALAAMAAQGLAHLLPNQTPFISAVAGVVLLLPGFMLTVAMSELATQNYLAGTGTPDRRIRSALSDGGRVGHWHPIQPRLVTCLNTGQCDHLARLGHLAGYRCTGNFTARRLAGALAILAGFGPGLPSSLGCLFNGQCRNGQYCRCLQRCAD